MLNDVARRKPRGGADSFGPANAHAMKAGILPLVALLVPIPVRVAAQDGWVGRTAIPASARWGVSSFTIGEFGYVVGGRDTLNVDLGETWAFRGPNAHWVPKAGLPMGRERRLASSWVADGYGFVACGVYNSGTKRNDLWKYDHNVNEWLQQGSLPGDPRYSAYAFAIGNIGYIGGGITGTNAGPFAQDLWSYDVSTNTWQQRTGLPGQGRFAASAFTVGDTAYVFGGKLDDLSVTDEFWKYVPATDTWTPITLPGPPGRMYAQMIGGSQGGLLVGGQVNGVPMQDAWYYRPATNAWEYVPPYPGQGTWGGCTFMTNDTAYVGLGIVTGVSHTDMWMIDLNTITRIAQVTRPGNGIALHPTVAAPGEEVHLVVPAGEEGRTLRAELVSATGTASPLTLSPDGSFLLPDLAAGCYALEVNVADGPPLTGRVMVQRTR